MQNYYYFVIRPNNRIEDNAWSMEAIESKRLIIVFLKDEYDPREAEISSVSYR